MGFAAKKALAGSAAKLGTGANTPIAKAAEITRRNRFLDDKWANLKRRPTVGFPSAASWLVLGEITVAAGEATVFAGQKSSQSGIQLAPSLVSQRGGKTNRES